jgi:plastocyanin
LALSRFSAMTRVMNGNKRPRGVHSLGCSLMTRGRSRGAWSSMVVLVVALGVAACGDDDDGSGGAAGPSGGTGGTKPAGRDGGPGGSTAAGDGGHPNHDAGPRECVRQTDCPLPDSECAVPICRVGRCGEAPLAAGKPVLAQVVGDCLEAVCDGKGAVMMRRDDRDVADDDQSCTLDACDDGVATHTPASARSTCAQDGGTRCDGLGRCVECTMNSDCTTNLCQDGACRPPPCGNLVKDGDETDVDCGGTCTGCGPDKACVDSDDCKGRDCSAGFSCVPNCADQVRNNLEADVDCGPGCDGCGAGDDCTVDLDCADGFCHPTEQTCATPTCGDGSENQDETGVDCGGSCPPCASGCTLDGDCTSGICYGGNCADSINECTPAGAESMLNMAAVTITFPNAGSMYTPKCLKVHTGTTVTFSGGDFAVHPLTGGIVVGGTAMPASSGPFTPATTSGTSALFTPTTAGSYPFYCDAHGASGMTGALFVVAP